MNWIRRTLSYVGFVLAALLALLLLRSFFYSDLVARTTQGSLTDKYSNSILEGINGKVRGRVYSSESPGKPRAPVAYQFRTRNASSGSVGNRKGLLGFYFRRESWGKQSRYTEFSAPHWPFVVVLSALAFALRPKPRWSYGVRELFAFLTVTAIIVGMIVAFINSRGFYLPHVDFRWV